MKIWHYELIPYLPKSQLLGQWRELNCIYAKEPRHILINYVYNEPKGVLRHYSDLVVQELDKRGYKHNLIRYNEYFNNIEAIDKHFDWHDFQYFEECYHNLREKFRSGQKDFTKDNWEDIDLLFGDICYNPYDI